MDYALAKHTTLHAGGAITTLLPNLWLENFVTRGFPLTFQPVATGRANIPVPFSGSVVATTLPELCVAIECGAGKRVWNHKQNRGNFEANPVFFEADFIENMQFAATGEEQ